MYRNYLLIAYRNFLKQKTYSFINVFGLAMGLASALLIFLYVHDELTFDSIHPGANDLYRIGLTYDDHNGNAGVVSAVPGRWTSAIQENLPEVKASFKSLFVGFPTAITNHDSDQIVLTKDGTFFWVTPDVLDVLYIPIVRGNTGSALREPNTIVISETAALRLFGSADPINRTLGIKHQITNDKEILVQVTAVYEDLPYNVHYRPEYMVNIAALSSAFAESGATLDQMTNGNSFNGIFFNSYVQLHDGSSITNLEDEMRRLSDELIQSDSSVAAQGFEVNPIIRNVQEIHFDTEVPWEAEGTGNMIYVIVFAGVAILILVIASINYMNLATARSSKRGMEVGLRKTFGGVRWQLASQFLQESFFITGLAFVASIIIVLLLLPYFNLLAQKSFTVVDLLNPGMLLIGFGVVLFVGFLGGSYPAFVLSAFNPVNVLKGQFSKGKGANLFRNILVTVQFCISIILVIITLVIVQQMDLMTNSKLNQSGDQLLSLRFGGTAPNNMFIPLKRAILEDPDIDYVTIGNHLPRLDYFGVPGAQFRFSEVNAEDYNWARLNVDFDFPKTYDLEFVAGRDFDPQSIADSAALILNEAAVAALGRSPNEVLGLSSLEVNNETAGTVIGVVRDFPFRSIYQPVEPLVISARQDPMDRIVYVKLPAGAIQEKVESIQNKWKELMPGIGLEYWFVDDEFNRMYTNEVTVSSLSKNFAVLALIITVLGLAGLASYTADQRTREIGIRKVMGANVSQVVLMLLVGFFKIFLVATIVAIPVSYWMADNWLTDFAYRTPLGLALFMVSLGGLALITLITVSFETMRAATSNPIKAIKHE